MLQSKLESADEQVYEQFVQECVNDRNFPITRIEALIKEKGINLSNAEYFDICLGCCISRHCDYQKTIHLIQLLRQYGFDLYSMGSTGTFLHQAIISCNFKIAEYLMEHEGFDINIPDRRGETPLHKAAFGRHPESVTFLLQRGADPNIKDKFGKRPLDYVNYEPTRQLLLPVTRQEVKLVPPAVSPTACQPSLPVAGSAPVFEPAKSKPFSRIKAKTHVLLSKFSTFANRRKGYTQIKEQNESPEASPRPKAPASPKSC